jgi:hypothetical protein
MFPIRLNVGMFAKGFSKGVFFIFFQKRATVQTVDEKNGQNQDKENTEAIKEWLTVKSDGAETSSVVNGLKVITGKQKK